MDKNVPNIYEVEMLGIHKFSFFLFILQYMYINNLLIVYLVLHINIHCDTEKKENVLSK